MKTGRIHLQRKSPDLVEGQGVQGNAYSIMH